MDRTMVKASSLANGIVFQTYSRARKISEAFYVFRSTFETLETVGYAVQPSSSSYAVFQRDDFNGTVSIRFAWLNHSGDRLFGWEETVVLNYAELMAFVRASAEADGPKKWRRLSIPPHRRQPRLVFRCNERLRECLGSKAIQRKLVKFLRDNFKWPRAERVEFYSDFVPYNFFFQEYYNGKPAMCGGVILHGQEDMAKAHYSIHT